MASTSEKHSSERCHSLNADAAPTSANDDRVLAPEGIPCGLRQILQLVFYDALRPEDGSG
jgi:hypothetical protein